MRISRSIVSECYNATRRYKSNQTRFAESIKDTSLLEVNKEKEFINGLPLIKDKIDKRKVNDVKITNSKSEYINGKLNIVRNIFGNDSTNENFINYKFPKGVESPFNAVVAKKKSVISNKITGTDRLSVTKLLTKRWCELRETYDIYSKIPMFETTAIKGGKVAHKKLETRSHPTPKEWTRFVEDFEMNIPTDKYHNYIEDLFNCSMRFVSLFKLGDAREILCHAYLDNTTGKFLKNVPNSDNDILVSGIIDHLTLTEKIPTILENPVKRPPFALFSVDYNDCFTSFQSLLSWLEMNKSYLESNYEIVVSDVKTRSYRSKPSQSSVILAAKYQAMYYHTFLHLLSLDPSVTYQNIIINAQRRGYDVDQPIDPAKLISLIESNNIIFEDMRHLRDGENINFEPFDSDARNYYSDKNSIYDLNKYSDIITDRRVLEKYGELFTNWKIPVSLRYMAARLAQMYHFTGPLLSDQLLIEYYCYDDNFHNIFFKYDEETITKEAFDSTLYWFGKREIEPIKPTVSNLLTYCKYCDYNKICAWKKNGEEHNRNLGRDLINMTKAQQM
ncbi:hypothetical protein TPHA_0L01510 [Tetrapisispora phaffii CBS 4417]|uniref:Exonuclease V, mitochondrial n=1 Tax=Tetrapisispora phaffii (strain ATCC 24235 / CBS 4417 / NBRC 1672 / NRRL Y-8282 / UCD 70-5) TaxID=1071381 RepID=G8C028_TETPH|nr:hypothetical protein TPHA_0L01510 [Tetrapisispora phaffii CBS 4417]CCE65506.1 hypothetical protein TPHA_0L01510 [Tetrapisispora phaffii CBS 4417]